MALAYLDESLATSMRSALYVLALGLAITALFVVVAFGAIIVLIYHDRGAGFSYLIGGLTMPKDF